MTFLTPERRPRSALNLHSLCFKYVLMCQAVPIRLKQLVYLQNNEIKTQKVEFFLKIRLMLCTVWDLAVNATNFAIWGCQLRRTVFSNWIVVECCKLVSARNALYTTGVTRGDMLLAL